MSELHETDDRDRNWRKRSIQALKSRKKNRRDKPVYDTPTLDGTPHSDRFATTDESQADPSGLIVWSYGGGVNSTAGIIDNINRGLRIDHIIFADTGSEKAETMAFLPIFEKYLLKHNLKLTYTKNTKWDSLLDNCMNKRIIPRVSIRWCTADFKKKPILKITKKLHKETKRTIYQYIGIASDESIRMKNSPEAWNPNVYPLYDYKINREKCKAIIAAEGLPIPEKSGCFFCMFQPISHWRKLYRDHRDDFNKAVKMEENDRNNHALLPTTKSKKRVYLRDLAKMFDEEKNNSDIAVYFKKEHGIDLDAQSDQVCGGDCMT